MSLICGLLFDILKIALTTISMNTTKLILSVSLFLLVVTTFAQSPKKSKEQAKYDTSYETKTLSPKDNPNLLSNNRWITPAGTQVYFGNPALENHALDVALSPDEKWVAVEGRYEVVILSTETGKLVANLPLTGLVQAQSLMNTFSEFAGFRKQISTNYTGEPLETKVFRLFWRLPGMVKS